MAEQNSPDPGTNMPQWQTSDDGAREWSFNVMSGSSKTVYGHVSSGVPASIINDSGVEGPYTPARYNPQVLNRSLSNEQHAGSYTHDSRPSGLGENTESAHSDFFSSTGIVDLTSPPPTWRPHSPQPLVDSSAYTRSRPVPVDFGFVSKPSGLPEEHGSSWQDPIALEPQAGQSHSPSSSVRNQRKRNALPPLCHICKNYQPRNPHDAIKHERKHTKPFKCPFPECQLRDVGFASENDRDRHYKSARHNLAPTKGAKKGYVCAACQPPPGEKEKWWPRLDNFKAHCRRKHREWPLEDLLHKSERDIDNKPVEAHTDGDNAIIPNAGKMQHGYDKPPANAASALQSDRLGHATFPNADNPQHLNAEEMTVADSGYQSGLPTEWHSVCERGAPDDDSASVATDGWASGLPNSDKRLLEAQFARELFNGIGTKAQERIPTRAEMVVNLIYCFAVMIGKRACSNTEKGAASFVRHGRMRIYGHLRDELVPEADAQIHDDAENMSLAEKMARWGTTCDSEQHTESLDPSEALPSEDDDEDELDAALLLGYSDLRNFLVESSQYEWLLRNLKTGLESEASETSQTLIRNAILKSLETCALGSTRLYLMTVQVPWKPKKFLDQQYGHLPDRALLGSVITLSGSGQDVYATTCQSYIESMWPHSGPRILSLLQALVDSTHETIESEDAGIHLKADTSTQCTVLSVIGDLLSLVEAAETLIWMSSACRASTSDKAQTCRLGLNKGALKPGLLLAADFVFDRVPVDDAAFDGACWHAMFRNPIIVEGYPIPTRTTEEKGLELSVELMLSMAGTSWATVYDGFVMLKGFATILVPTFRTARSVVWHFTANTQGERLSFNDGLGRSCLRDINDALFPGARHFVGWLKSAEYLVGSKKADYHNLGFAKGDPTNAGLRADKAITISGGKYVSVGVRIMRGLKDTPEFLDIEDYVKNIEESAKWKVILSDTKSRQHWLADGASTILHLCRAYLSGKYTRADLRDVTGDIWMPTSIAGPESSVRMLLRESNRSLRLYTSNIESEEKTSMSNKQPNQLRQISDDSTITKKWFLFQNQAHLFCHWLEQIHDRMMRARHSSDGDLLRLFEGPRLIGFELRDLLGSNSDLEPYTLKLCDDSKAWLPYSKSVDAIHLHGSKLGDLLGPLQEPCERPRLCGLGTTAPQGKDSLMAPLSVLKEGMERFEHTDVCAQLAHGMYWNNVNAHFSSCQCQHSKSSGRCKVFITELFTKRPKHSLAHAIVDDLPRIFRECPTAAVIIGGETQSTRSRIKQHLSVVGRKRTIEDCDQVQRAREEQSIHQERQVSDSAYGSNSGNASSGGSLTSSMVAGSPSDEDAVMADVTESVVDGAVSTSPTKRRKVNGEGEQGRQNRQ
ncbi:hypothetical protein Q7P37_002903 [Cladosporium fusiforme]